MILKKIEVGRFVTVSSRSVISGGAVLMDGCFVEPFTLVPEDAAAIPKNQTWGES